MLVHDSIVIIPTYNEKENIENILRYVFSLPKAFHVLVIEDNSPDGTADIVKSLMKEFPNRLFIEEITTDRAIGEMAGNMIPKEINSIDATFSIMKPYKIAIDANGSFGEIVGGIYLNMNKIFLRIIKPKDINSFKNFLKRDTKGLYYEKFFNQ